MMHKEHELRWSGHAPPATPGEQILYIVGNGFDLHHGVQSSYAAFGRYLKAADPDTYDQLERYFSVDDDFWWQFETQLAYLDTDSLLDDAAVHLASYGADDWSDAGHHDYEYELDRVVAAISSTLRLRFSEWVRQLVIPSSTMVISKLLPLRGDARYLTFNYTNTLQRLYGIPDASVIHIHGAAARENDQLVLGHGWERTAADYFTHNIDPESADVRVIGGYEIVDQYFTETFKPTARVIETHQPVFRSLSSIKKIFIMGHSLSNVDLPYLLEIRRHLGNGDIQWQVSFHGSSEGAEAGMESIGVNANEVRFVPLTEPAQWACP
ncbi:bacteriophage abortive infection AbiH family protein [Ralstonia pseudosolanacearum]